MDFYPQLSPRAPKATAKDFQKTQYSTLFVLFDIHTTHTIRLASIHYIAFDDLKFMILFPPPCQYYDPEISGRMHHGFICC